MNVLFVHQNYPAQFGTIAAMLNRRFGWNCVFATKWKGEKGAVPLIKYADDGNATAKIHFQARHLDVTTRAAVGVYRALKEQKPRLKPDVIVGHSGFGSTLFLSELFDCPVVNLFEFYYRIAVSGNSFRPEFPMDEELRQRLHFLNATILLDLHEAAAGYTPTHFQRNQFPKEYLHKIETLFDGIDTGTFKRIPAPPRMIKDREIPEGVKIVSYVSRGFESMRGFDIFIKVAKRIYEEYPNVIFICAGTDRICYGGDKRFTGGKSFREYVEDQEHPDPSKFFYTGLLPTAELVRLLSLSDVHLYFTVPFVLSWSLINSMSCSCRIVSCRVAPIEEVLLDGQSALLADFYDVEGHAQNALKILRGGEEYAFLGENARRTVEARYALERTLPGFMRLLGRVTGRQTWPPQAVP